MNNILVLLLITDTLAYLGIKRDDFDYFKLTVIYPSSVCRVYNEPGKFITKKTSNSCKIPVDASPWTIHGLWPNRKDGSYPQFCGKGTKKFVLSKLLPIEEKLKRNWPNLLSAESISSLWKHEWERHGTCAGIVKEVSDEAKYFNKTLALYEQFDIFGTLKKQEIVPSQEKLYDWLSLHQALKTAYGTNAEFHCLRDKETKNWLLADVRLCLTKNFELMDCEERSWKWQKSKESLLSTYEPCPANGIIYLPFSNAHSIGTNNIIILVVFSMLYIFCNFVNFL